MYIFLLFLTISITTATCTLQPLETGDHYSVYRRSDYDRYIHSTLIKSKRTFTVGTTHDLRTVQELPTNNTSPEDDGITNFGDLEFEDTDKTGELVGRDTVMNVKTYDEDIVLAYSVHYDARLTDARVLNFGRDRGYAYKATIYHAMGNLEAEIIVGPRKQVRLLIETFGTNS